MDLVIEARKFALAEIEKYGLPSIPHFEIAEKKAIELGENFEVDLDIVKVGIYLMDVKLGQAFREGRPKDHVSMSADSSREFLKKFSIPDEKKEKIINCVSAHHAQIPFSCKEAEIVANADCYRFLHPYGVFAFLHTLAKDRSPDFLDSLEQAEAKMDEKWNILSLDICKKELAQYHKSFKQFFADARDY